VGHAGAVFITFLLMCVLSEAAAQKLDNPVKYSARDSMRYDLPGQTVYLFGAATVKYGDVELSADRIVLDMKNEEAQAHGAPDSTGAVVGKPAFVQDGHSIEADSIRYNFKTKQGMIREVRTQEQEIWVHAGLSKRQADGEVHSRFGMLTTCDRPQPHYHFRVGKMMVIPDNKIITGPAIMKVGKIPTPLALPFGMFPNKKGGSSGVLIPTWGSNQQLGYFLLNGGYYFPINDHVDLQLTGDIYSRGSWALRGVSRYRSRYRYTGNVDLSHSTLLNGDPEFPDFSKQQNFFFRWNHNVDPRASLTDRFNASVNIGTSQNFTNNFNSSTNDYLSNTFQSNISWTHIWPGKPYNLTANVRHSQNTLNGTFDITIPSVTFNLTRILPIQLLRPVTAPSRWYDQLAVSYSANAENRLSTTEDQLYLGNMSYLSRQMRNGVRQNATVSTTFKNKLVTINPEFRVTERWYFKTLSKTYDPETNSTEVDTLSGFSRVGEWNAGASMTSKLYGMYSFYGERIKAIRHVITPSAGFTYRPDQSTEIEGPFGVDGTPGSYSPYDIGIYGKPPSGQSGTLNLGIIQNIEAKVRDGKVYRDSTAAPDAELYRKLKLIDYLGINSTYDVLKDSLRWSPINISARTSLFNVLNLNVVSLWDPYAVDAFGTRYDRSQRSVNGQLARMVYTNVALGFDLKSPRYGQAGQNTASEDKGKVVEDSDPSKGASVNFSLPWRLGVNYSYDINRVFTSTDEFTDSERQSVLFNGDLNILKHWKFGFSSGYDLVAGDWTPTSLNLYWDLHCWEFNFNIIPIGERKSFMFRINIKASILRDLKYEQRQPYGNDSNLLF
jgi:hypothetical protein